MMAYTSNIKEKSVSVLNMSNICLLNTRQPIKHSLESKGYLRNNFNFTSIGLLIYHRLPQLSTKTPMRGK